MVFAPVLLRGLTWAVLHEWTHTTFKKYDIINKNTAEITAAVTKTHHEIALRFKLKLRYLVICAAVTAAVITAAFFNNITPFKNAAKDSLSMLRQYKKIHFLLGKIYYIYIYYIYIFTFVNYE